MEDPTYGFNKPLCEYISRHYPEIVGRVFAFHAGTPNQVLIDSCVSDVTMHNVRLTGTIRVRSKSDAINKSITCDRWSGPPRKECVTIPFDKVALTPLQVVDEFCEIVRFAAKEMLEDPPETKFDEMKTCVSRMRLEPAFHPRPPKHEESILEWPDTVAVVFEFTLFCLVAAIVNPSSFVSTLVALNILGRVACVLIALKMVNGDLVKAKRKEWLVCVMLCGLPGLASLHLCRKGFTRSKFVQ
eukprot:c52160_g1_i1.p1 GENE.c52160_g1_i1~~c52160_g1_i1.p1  ORF type:complete len:243 (-),score=58.01 c52160_g1_i1:84-812(-)